MQHGVGPHIVVAVLQYCKRGKFRYLEMGPRGSEEGHATINHEPPREKQKETRQHKLKP